MNVITLTLRDGADGLTGILYHLNRIGSRIQCARLKFVSYNYNNTEYLQVLYCVISPSCTEKKATPSLLFWLAANTCSYPSS